MTSGCDVQWNGPCEAGWSGWGDTGKLEMVQQVGNPSNHMVMITPGSSFWNGMHRSFEMSGSGPMKFDFTYVAVEGTVKMGMRAEFKNASGTTIGTDDKIETVSGYGIFTAHFPVPSGTASVELYVGAKDGSAGATLGLGAELLCLTLGGCIGGHVEPPEGFCSSLACPEEPEDACGISCPSGSPVMYCEEDFANCELILECYCDDAGSIGEDESWF